MSSLELELEGTITAFVTKSALPRSPCRFSSDPELSLIAAYLRLRGVLWVARPGVETMETGGGTRGVAGTRGDRDGILETWPGSVRERSRARRLEPIAEPDSYSAI